MITGYGLIWKRTELGYVTIDDVTLGGELLSDPRLSCPRLSCGPDSEPSSWFLRSNPSSNCADRIRASSRSLAAFLYTRVTASRQADRAPTSAGDARLPRSPSDKEDPSTGSGLSAILQGRGPRPIKSPISLP